jgi:hypothetical protein
MSTKRRGDGGAEENEDQGEAVVVEDGGRKSGGEYTHDHTVET